MARLDASEQNVHNIQTGLSVHETMSNDMSRVQSDSLLQDLSIT